MSKEISISFRSEPDEQYLQSVGKAVGKYGFDAISVYEDLGDQSPMYPLMTLAKYAPEARIGPACIVVPKYRTMEPIVGDISRLDSLSNGKAYLGLAPGSWMEQLGLQPTTVDQLREAAEVSKYLLERKKSGYDGKFYTVKPNFELNYSTPDHRVPILIGAWGPRMAALGGELADEVKVGGSANPLMVGVIKGRVEVGARRANRNIDDIGIVMGAVTVIDEDRRRAINMAKERAVVYISVIGDKDPTAVEDFREEIEAIKRFVARGDIEAAKSCLPEELSKRFMFAGSPDDIIRQAEAIFENGASRVEFGGPHGINTLEGIRLLGEKVIPYFK